MSNTIPHKRLNWVDWAKFILIVLVCVGHFGPSKTQLHIICGMHMPAFFIISGYLYHRHSAQKTFLSFSIPVIFFSCVCFLLYIIESYLQTGSFDIKSNLYYRFFEEFFFRNTNNPYESERVHLYLGLWFIWGLFGCRLLAGDIKLFSFTLKYKYWTLAFLLLWLSVNSNIGFDNSLRYFKLYYAVYAYPFFLFGNILKEEKIQFSFPKWIIIIFLIIYVVVSCIFPFGMMNYGFGPNYLIFFINAILGSLVLFSVCSKFNGNKIIQVFSIGTLLILPMHKHIEFFTLPVFHRVGITPALNQDIVAWMVAFVVLLVSYFPIIKLYAYCPILLGKIQNKNKNVFSK